MLVGTAVIQPVTTYTPTSQKIHDFAENGTITQVPLWVPYVVLTGVILSLLCASFVRFHVNNKERYQKRGVMAQSENTSALYRNGVVYLYDERRMYEPDSVNRNPDAMEVLEVPLNSSTHQVSPPIALGQSDDHKTPVVRYPREIRQTAQAISIPKCEQEMDIVSISSDESFPRITDREHNTYGNASDIGDPSALRPEKWRGAVYVANGREPGSIVGEMDENIVRTVLAKRTTHRINCRQSLTFMTRNSKVGVQDHAQGGYGELVGAQRWLSNYPNGRANVAAPSSGVNTKQHRTPVESASKLSNNNGLISFMGNRMKEPGHSVKLNMWSKHKPRSINRVSTTVGRRY